MTRQATALTPLTVAAIYAGVASVWIVFSDRVVKAAVSDPQMLTTIQTAKGWFFVAVTAVVLYLLVRGAVRRLRESQRRFETLISNLPGAAYRCRNDQDWSMEYISDGCLELTGHSAADLVQGTVTLGGDLIHPEDRERVWQDVQDALANRKSFQLTYRITHADANIRWVWEQGRGIFSPDAQLLGLEGFITDISQYKQSEYELRDREERLRAIVDTAVEGIITINERGLIDSFNAAAERMFDYSAAEVLGKNVSLLMPSPYREEHGGYLENYQRTGTRKIIGIGREVLGRRKDGSTFPMHLSVSESTVSTGRLFTGIVRDKSEEKRLERQIQEVSTREQQRIGRDLHDGLGQELTGISFLADVLQSQLASERHSAAETAEEIAKLVRKSIDHARGLVKGLCPVNLEADGLMQALEDLATMVHQVYGLDCAFRCEAPVLIHHHDIAMHVYYIGHEAVHNAIKHGHPKSLVISLTQDREQGRLTIEDDGSGLPANPERRGGSGLQIMKYRATMIDGELNVDNNPDGGVRVSCRFPLVTSQRP